MPIDRDELAGEVERPDVEAGAQLASVHGMGEVALEELASPAATSGEVAGRSGSAAAGVASPAATQSSATQEVAELRRSRPPLRREGPERLQGVEHPSSSASSSCTNDDGRSLRGSARPAG